MSTRDDVAALERELAGLALDAKKVRTTTRKRTTTRISWMHACMICARAGRTNDWLTTTTRDRWTR